MMDVEMIKQIVNMPHVGTDPDSAENFMIQFNMLSGTDHKSLDDILNVLKSNKLQQLMQPQPVATNRVMKYNTDEERRLARNEASRRCIAKKKAAMEAAAQQAK